MLVTILPYRDGGISPGQHTQPPALCTFFSWSGALRSWCRCWGRCV